MIHAQQANTLLITDTAPKVGVARTVEEAVQAQVLHAVEPAQELPLLQQKLLAHVRGQGISGRYERAKRFRQAIFATVLFEGCRVALPRMAEQYIQQGTLVPPVDAPFDLDTYWDPNVLQAMPAPQITALRSAYWLVDGVQQALEAMRQSNHPLHDVYTHVEESNMEYYLALGDWKKGPGKNRFPATRYTRPGNGRHSLAAFVCLGVSQGIEIMSSKAVHHLITYNNRADAAELDAVAAQSVPQLSWFASTDRHLGWTPDWQQQKHVGPMAFDGIEAMLQTPVSKIVAPNEYAASVDGLPVMREPNFCPHPMVQDGPVAKGSSCTGEPRVSYRENELRRAAGDFFKQMGFAHANGEYFNLTAVTVAMGRRLLQGVILPVYEANRKTG